MKRKSVLLTFVLIFVAITCAVTSYNSVYRIELTADSLTESIRAFYCRGSNEDLDPTIVLYNSAVVGDSVYYLLEIDQDFGYAKLQRGLNGKHRLLLLSYGSPDFDSSVLEHGEQKYLLFSFRDNAAQIAKISLELSGHIYDLDVPADTSRFLFCREIDPKTIEKAPDLTHITLYNANGDDITVQYDLSRGIFQ